LRPEIFAERALDKRDARRRAVSLTREGEGLLRKGNSTLERELDELLSVLGDAELERFFDAFETITEPNEENE
jgi:DNA-binding MarR family transcriptional regulator